MQLALNKEALPQQRLQPWRPPVVLLIRTTSTLFGFQEKRNKKRALNQTPQTATRKPIIKNIQNPHSPHHDSPALGLDFSNTRFLIIDRQLESKQRETENSVSVLSFFLSGIEREREVKCCKWRRWILWGRVVLIRSKSSTEPSSEPDSEPEPRTDALAARNRPPSFLSISFHFHALSPWVLSYPILFYLPFFIFLFFYFSFILFFYI